LVENDYEGHRLKIKTISKQPVFSFPKGKTPVGSIARAYKLPQEEIAKPISRFGAEINFSWIVKSEKEYKLFKHYEKIHKIHYKSEEELEEMLSYFVRSDKIKKKTLDYIKGHA